MQSSEDKLNSDFYLCKGTTLWYVAHRLNEGMNTNAATALNALWKKLV